MKFATKPLQYKSFIGRVVVTPKVTPKVLEMARFFIFFHFSVFRMSKFMYQQKCNREGCGIHFYIGCSKFILLFSKEKSKSKY